MFQFPIDVFSDPAKVPFAFGRTAQLFTRWTSMRETNGLPRADRLDMVALKSLLPDLVIFEVPDMMTVRYRLAGTMAVKQLGFEPRGMNLVDLALPRMRAAVGIGFDLIARRKIGALLHFTLLYGEEEVPARVEQVLLPMQAPEGQAPRVLSLSCRDAFPYGKAPYGVYRPTEAIEDVTLFDIGFGLPDLSAILGIAAA